MSLDRGVRIALPVLAAGLFGVMSVGEMVGVAQLGGLGYDFQAYYDAARRMLAGQPVYDLGAEFIGQAGDFYYPPSFLLVVAPFALLPFEIARFAWVASIVLSTTAAIALLPASARVRWTILLLVGASSPYLNALGLGQIVTFQLLLVVIGWRWIESSTVLGVSVALGAMIKVQPIALLGWMVLRRRLRSASVTLLLGGAILLATNLVAGAAAWRDFVTVLAQVSRPVMTPRSLSLGHLAFEAGLSPIAASAVQAGVILFVIGAVLLAIRTGTLVSSYLVVVVGAQLLSPVLWDHYAALLFAPIAWLLSRGERWIVVVPLATSTFLVGVMPGIVYPAGHLVVMAVLVVSGRRAATEARAVRATCSRRDGPFDIVRLRKQATDEFGGMVRSVTPTLEADPDCARPIEPGDELIGAEPADPGAAPAATPRTARTPRTLRAERTAFGDIDPATWDRLAALNPHASPFSSWAFHRAWWDAYGANAHDQTVVVLDAALDPGAAAAAGPGPAQPVAIVPLMHRHVVEASDAETHTMIRHADGLPLTPLAPTACVVYFGASYHADYATILAAPADLDAVAQALVDAFAIDAIGPGHEDPWSAIDLRRLRAADPATHALAAAFGAREIAEGWTLNVEREDVCPVIRLPDGADMDGFLSTLGKKERHEIRRKVRRAAAAGDVRLEDAANPLDDLEAFIDLHQARWGSDGLFPASPGGDQSRRFFRRLFELADPAVLRLAFLTAGGRRIAAAVFFETEDAILYYNAGVDPDARDLSPGVVLLERLVRRAIDDGRCRVDLMRGNEPYKYEWGGVDEPVQRLLVRRTGTLDGAHRTQGAPA